MQDNFKQENPYNIPTIRQVLQDLQIAHKNMSQTLSQLDVKPLSQQCDIQSSKIGIKKIMKKIPAEQDIQKIWEYSNRSWIPKVMQQYKGDYELIKTAKDNFQNLKKQQKKLYYIAVQLNLPSISPEFKQADPQKLQQLCSYRDVAVNKKQIVNKIEKNTVSQYYFQELAEKYQGLYCPDPKLFIQKYQHLINICYYDSYNGQKQYQYTCIGQQTLDKIVKKFDCLISHLDDYYRLSQKQQPLLDYKEVRKKLNKQKLIKQNRQEFEIMIEFDEDLPKSQLDPYNNIARQKKQYLEPINQYIMINDCIYYGGSKIQIEKMLDQSNIMNRRQLHFYQLAKTKIQDLRVIFGHPYLYSHLKGCDHMVVFKQGRLFMGNDGSYNFQMPFKQEYPVKVFQSKMKRKKCEGCGQKFADLVSLSDPLKNQCNLYICLECHHDIHYNKDGDIKYEKLKLIPYVHD